MRLFRQRGADVKAVQFTGHNDAEVSAFVGFMGEDPVTTYPSWKVMGVGGWQEARVGDWIVQPVMTTVSCFTVIANDEFNGMYEEVKDDDLGS